MLGAQTGLRHPPDASISPHQVPTSPEEKSSSPKPPVPADKRTAIIKEDYSAPSNRITARSHPHGACWVLPGAKADRGTAGREWAWVCGTNKAVPRGCPGVAKDRALLPPLPLLPSLPWALPSPSRREEPAPHPGAKTDDERTKGLAPGPQASFSQTPRPPSRLFFKKGLGKDSSALFNTETVC